MDGHRASYRQEFSSSSEFGLQTNNSTSSTNATYDFLVQSQDTLTSRVPSSRDQHASGRSKRKRTSPEDHAILEAEYEKNPKPDKVARNEIVKRVALGEKEVQIWFQNRRQMTRRKSRPLLPHEIYPKLRSSQASIEGQLSSSFLEGCSNEAGSSQTILSDTQVEALGLPDNLGTSCRSESIGDNDFVSEKSQEGTALARYIDDGKRCIETLANTEESNHEAVDSVVSEHSTASAGRVELEGNYQEDTKEADAPLVQSLPTIPALERKSSSLRLSMSFNGKAEIVVGKGNSPSPPRPTPRATLQRSKSAVVLGSRIQDPGHTLWPTRSAPGRSRDARTWEFYCDSDVRNALTKQAEQAQKGDAVGIIGLLRSGSAHAVTMKPDKHKSVKCKGLSERSSTRSKLARTTSSVAQLQTASTKRQKQVKPVSGQIHEDDGDSDKENWVPGTQHRMVRRDPQSDYLVPLGASRAILGINERIPSHCTSLGSLLDRGQFERHRFSGKIQSEEDKENNEVAAFMGETNVAREDEDLDCVQNLLSLSQAAWQ